MSTLTITELQQIVTVNNHPDLLAAAAAFDEEVTTQSQITALSEHYFIVVFYFNQIRELVGDDRLPNYGCNSPEAMLEYIDDRSKIAVSALAAAEAAENYVEPNDSAQEKPLYWFDDSASGSASASTSTSASGS